MKIEWNEWTEELLDIDVTQEAFILYRNRNKVQLGISPLFF